MPKRQAPGPGQLSLWGAAERSAEASTPGDPSPGVEASAERLPGVAASEGAVAEGFTGEAPVALVAPSLPPSGASRLSELVPPFIDFCAAIDRSRHTRDTLR